MSRIFEGKKGVINFNIDKPVTLWLPKYFDKGVK